MFSTNICHFPWEMAFYNIYNGGVVLIANKVQYFDMKVGTLYPLLHSMVGSGYPVSYKANS